MTFQHPAGNEPATYDTAKPYADLTHEQLTVLAYRLEKQNEEALDAVRNRLSRMNERNHALADVRAEMQRRRYA